MDYKTLLDRYYEGQTTLEEERLLREHFAGEASCGTPEQVIFGACDEAASRRPGRTYVVRKRNPRRRAWAIAGAAAAMVAVVLTALTTQPKPTIYAYVNGEPITDYQVAYDYTREAFMVLDDNMQKSTESLASLQTMNESLQYIEMLSKI